MNRLNDHRRPAVARAAFEALEGRQLMSTTVVDGWLRVTGTPNNDAISVGVWNGQYTVSENGQTTIWAGNFEGVDVRAGYGNDTVRLAPEVTIQSDVAGGPGDDALYGGGGNDWLYGGPGDDRLYAGVGNHFDALFGEAGNDTLVTAGNGWDQAYGGGGTDNLWVDPSDTTDAGIQEMLGGWFHNVNLFANVASLNVNGQNLADPGLTGYAGHYGPSFSSTPLFGSGGPKISDVRQGGLGDCWFMSGLASVAKAKPDVVRQAVTELGDGTYAVRIFDGGNPLYYRVDGQLALRNSDNGVFFAQPANNTIWAPIMEKAYAIHRSGGHAFKAMNGGWGDEIMRALGKYTESDDVAWHGQNTLAGRMRTRLLNGGAVTACTDPAFLGCSIVASHCYSVVDVSSDLKTVTLRNPWGTDGKTKCPDGNNDGYIKISMDQFDDDVWQIQYGWL